MCSVRAAPGIGASRPGAKAPRGRAKGEVDLAGQGVSASIVVYGGWQEAAAAANSVLRYTQAQPFSLYLIDNASPDGSARQLGEAVTDPRAELIALPANRGFGGGHNAVLSRLSSRYHFVLNPDILIEEDVLGAICGWMDAHPDVVMATPQLYFPDGRIQHLPRRKPNLMGLLARQLPGGALERYNRHYTMQDEDLTEVQDIQFCTGSFFCIRTEVFQEMGGFDEGYFMYVEDADITQKALQYGRVCLLPQFRAIHAWHRTPAHRGSHFMMQLKSMGRYFRKWGFALK